ncbi:cytochrome c family protein [Novipirellula rosea]|uniref:Multiheme c-type cytochrome n=1 Tax=Novipirellula rosea TaxID=1031540 RepID=A0ABP8N7D8_9BACT
MIVRWIVLTTLCLLTSSIALGTTPSASAGAAVEPASPASPHLVVGNQACVKCHAAEIEVWRATPHAKTFDELHRRPEAKQIAAKLGLTSIKNEGRCVACHYTQQTDLATNHTNVIAGVSCESCHGPAKNWIDLHQDYGGEGITRLTETEAHRKERIANSIHAGMRNPENVYLVAQSCLRCHTAADEQLVNVGGHSVGSLDFEFVSWSQGLIRHNFVRTDGKSNDVSSPERLRVMFVAGMIAELEAGLRATAVATEKATYGITAAKRTARAAAKLKSVAAKVSVPVLDEILGEFASVKLKLNNADELTAAADRIARLGFAFADQVNPVELAPMDAFIPAANRWK